MSQFVEDCGDGSRSNPLLNYVRRYTDDKSGWQDQFLEEERNHPYFGPMQFGPPPPQAMMDKQMVDEFLNPGYNRFDRFDIGPPHGPMVGPPGMPEEFIAPSRLPPQVFDEFIHSQGRENLSTEPFNLDVQVAPQDASKIRNRSQIMSRHFNPEAEAEGSVSTLLDNLQIGSEETVSSNSPWQEANMQQRHGGWIKDYAAANDPQNFDDFEKSWNPRPVTEGQRWAKEFPEEEFEDVYSQVSEKNRGKEWAESYNREQEQQAKEEDYNWKEVAKQAAQINDPQLQNSQFMQFINKMATGELGIKDGQLVPARGSQMASEFLAEQSWADQFEGDRPWADQYTDSQKWADQFSQDWSQEFLKGDWEKGDWQERELIDKYTDVWDKLQEKEKENQQYQFQSENKYTNDPEALQKGIAFFDQGNLPEAILALEAAVQQSPQNTQAWCKLGMAHAENDKDSLAIVALQQALQVDPENLEALMCLAVSHTNEFHQGKAVLAIRDWLLRNPRYKNLFPSNTEFADLRQVEEMFIVAAKSSSEIDPMLHSALGLIYNLSFEYDKAIDCFRAALTERPDDYQLWNKLGATTANSTRGRERAPEAIDAYFRALQRKPTYTRARANLGISYMATQNYTEAAKCFLGAVEINNAPHLWDNLKSAFTMMERPDLIEKMTHQRDVNLFRDEFDF